MFLTELRETCFLIRKKLLYLAIQVPLFSMTKKNPHYFSIILEKTCIWDRHYCWIVKRRNRRRGIVPADAKLDCAIEMKIAVHLQPA